MAGVKYIASVSFGKDSLAMMLRLLEEKYPLDAVVFYNTHMEFEAIYCLRDKVKPLLQKRGVEFVELCPEEPFLVSMLDRKIKYRNREGYHYGCGWCGGPCRWGTSSKLKAIKTYKKSLNDEVTDYVGIAADEPQRFEKAKSEGKILPLVGWNMTEADCLSYCHERGFYWLERSFNTGTSYIDLYDILDRVSCWCCANKNLKELRNIYMYLPHYWEKLKALETQIGKPMKGSGKGIADLERRFQLEEKWIEEGKNVKSKAFYRAIKRK